MTKKEFLTLTDIKTLLELRSLFDPLGYETVSIESCFGRVSSVDIFSEENLPPFNRSTVDGFAVTSSSTFGASEGNPACLNFTGKAVEMAKKPDFSLRHAEAARIPTGGIVPEGSDAVVMIEHAEVMGSDILEVFRPAAPGANIIFEGDDIKKGDLSIMAGTRIRTQETGILAALGKTNIKVRKKPVVGIISTGDEIVSADKIPSDGQIRDVNTHTMSSMVAKSGGLPIICGLVKDDFHELMEACKKGLEKSDILLISGGSSVGARDYTLDIIKKLTGGEILVQGVSMSPGKPVILGKAGQKQIWGLPGHVTSAMIVFHVLVRPFINKLEGLQKDESIKIPAILSRNVASANGRTDFIRVRLIRSDSSFIAEPVIGKSGLLFTLLKSDGLIEIPKNCEGLNEGDKVEVILFEGSF